MIYQEQELREYLDTVKQNRQNMQAVYLAVSGLQKDNRKPELLRPIIDILAERAARKKCVYFSVNSRDIFIFYPQENTDEMESAFFKIRFALSKDPLVKERPFDFIRRFNLVKNFEDLERFVSFFVSQAEDPFYNSDLVFKEETLPAGVKKNLTSLFEHRQPKKTKYLDLGQLATLEKMLKSAEISSIIRRQGVCAVIGRSAPQMLFEEVFINLADLQAAVLPGVEVYGSPLFFRVAESLDKRLLTMISRHEDGALRKDFSININVATVLSPEFSFFDDHIAPAEKHSVVVELQPADIFSDLETFTLARNFLKDAGYKLCIDGLTVETFALLDRERLGADFLKIVWNAAVKNKGFPAIKAQDVERVILCRVDEDQTIREAQKVGISLFQGRAVQDLLRQSSSVRARKTGNALLEPKVF